MDNYESIEVMTTLEEASEQDAFSQNPNVIAAQVVASLLHTYETRAFFESPNTASLEGGAFDQAMSKLSIGDEFTRIIYAPPVNGTLVVRDIIYETTTNVSVVAGNIYIFIVNDEGAIEHTIKTSELQRELLIEGF